MDKRQYDLVKFLENKTQELRLQENGDLYCWVGFDELGKLTEIIGYDYLCEGGIDVNLQSDCVVITINDLLDYFGIDEDVFTYGKAVE